MRNDRARLLDILEATVAKELQKTEPSG